ncbi:hypothetical protein [Alkalilacustris brevis]|uniref:hypothetical protein n=1 Tax=Alkalilacustris brevis TaxID=2026338 RepID=UPI000E0D5BE2|nr:hypothetical protein [Alkalilacustris brevis]
MLRFLWWSARNGRLVLVGGLVLGVALPGLAQHLQPAIVPIIAFLLFLAALRIGPAAARPRLAELPGQVALTLVLQTLPPMLALGVLFLAGWADSLIGIGVVLLLAASPISGSPGLAVLSGSDPVPALRQLVLGTALLPLTALPVLWLMPVFGDAGATLAAAGRLMAIIAVAGGGGLLLRALVPRFGSPGSVQAIDGLTALSMMAVVVALMSAVSPALLSGAPEFWWILALLLVLNFGAQILAWALARQAGARNAAPAIGIIAGNRNLALFFGALPPDLALGLLLFLGVYQFPMYLTPLVMPWVYRRLERRARA